MILDLRFPMGMLFTALGLLLAGYGLLGDQAVYAVSLGINVNLWAGAGILVFGLAMLAGGWQCDEEVHLRSGMLTAPPAPSGRPAAATPASASGGRQPARR